MLRAGLAERRFEFADALNVKGSLHHLGGVLSALIGCKWSGLTHIELAHT